MKVDGPIPDHWNLADDGVEQLRSAAATVSLGGFPGGASLGIVGDRFEFQQVVAVDPVTAEERNRSAERAVAEACEVLGLLAADLEWTVLEVPPLVGGDNPGVRKPQRATAVGRQRTWLRRLLGRQTRT